MPSYTTNLRLTLPATGELSGQWGNTVNTGITELLDAAVAGTATISSWGGAGVPYTLSNNPGTADEARKMFIVATGAPGEAKNVICPAVSKLYFVYNNTTGGYALTLKTSGGSGISVPNGARMVLYCDGTNVVEAVNESGYFVAKTGATGSAALPNGTTAQRDASPLAGYIRFNSSNVKFEGYNGTVWSSVGGGATGGGSDEVFIENGLLATTSYSIGAGAQASCTISIASPAVITQANTFVAGQPVRFTTSGALPTGLSTNEVYYVISSGLSSSAFQVSTTSGGAAVNTSGSQSGTHTCGAVRNASTVGPLVVQSGVTVTVPSGSRLVIL